MWVFKRNKKEMKLDEVSKLLENFKSPYAYVTTPLNLKEEKEKFLNSNEYEPKFKYGLLKNTNDDIISKLSGVELISDVDPRISDYYIQLIKEKNLSNELYKAIGNNELVTKLSIEKYGFPTTKLFNNSVLATKGKLSSINLNPILYKNSDKVLNSDEILSVLDYFLNEYGFKDFKVIFSARENTGVRVGTGDKEVVLGSRDITRSKFDLRKLVVHEIGTHLFRWYNGEKTGIPALSGISGKESITIEEGFASYNEEFMGLLSQSGLKGKARLTYAIYVGKDLSFRQLYNVMRGFVPKEAAFRYCLRVKRGLGDMSLPGIYSKGVIYFQGYQKVRKAIQKDSSIHRKLFAGKISLKQVKWVDDGLIPMPELVIDPVKFNSTFQKLGI